MDLQQYTCLNCPAPVYIRSLPRIVRHPALSSQLADCAWLDLTRFLCRLTPCQSWRQNPEIWDLSRVRHIPKNIDQYPYAVQPEGKSKTQVLDVMFIPWVILFTMVTKRMVSTTNESQYNLWWPVFICCKDRLSSSYQCIFVSSLPVPQAALRLSDLRALLSSIRFRSLHA